MAAAATLTVDLNASTARFQQELDRASVRLNQFEKDTGSALDRIKKQFGGRSAFKDVVELFKGSGAVVGLSLAFNSMAAGLDALDGQMKKFGETGKIAWGEIAAGAVNAIPIIGHFTTSLGNVLQTWNEIRLRAKEGIPLPQGPAGQGARDQDVIAGSQSSINDINKQMAEDAKNIGADAHQIELNNIDKELAARLESIDKAREAEIKAIMKVRKFEDTAAGRRQAEGEFATRGIDFEGAKQEAQKQAADKKAVSEAKITQDGLAAAQAAKAKEVEAAAKAQGDAEKKTADAAARIFESTRTPAEKMTEKMTELNTLVASGALDWDTYSRAAAKAQEEFDGSQPKEIAQLAKKSPIATGTAARAFRFTEGFPGGARNPVESNTKAIVENNRLQRDNNRLLQTTMTRQSELVPSF